MLNATKEQFLSAMQFQNDLLEEIVIAQGCDKDADIEIKEWHIYNGYIEISVDVHSSGQVSSEAYRVSTNELYKTYCLSSHGGNRPDWDEIWMTFAGTIAQRSIDNRRKVGAIIVSENNSQVLALGYNGDYRGGPNAVLSSIPGQSGCIHAEINALLKLDFNYPGRKRMYVTTMPCYQCAAACINAGIDEVIYRDDYRDDAGIKILKASGVVVRKFNGV